MGSKIKLHDWFEYNKRKKLFISLMKMYFLILILLNKEIELYLSVITNYYISLIIINLVNFYQVIY